MFELPALDNTLISEDLISSLLMPDLRTNVTMKPVQIRLGSDPD